MKLNRDVAGAGFELGSHLNRRDQQHAAFIAIVGHAAHWNFLGCWPHQIARIHTRRQLPLQFSGQPRVARIAPIGVPMGLVLQLQAQPKCFARHDAFGGMNLQGGLNLGCADYLTIGFAGLRASQDLRLRMHRCPNKQAKADNKQSLKMFDAMFDEMFDQVVDLKGQSEGANQVHDRGCRGL